MSNQWNVLRIYKIEETLISDTKRIDLIQWRHEGMVRGFRFLLKGELKE